MTKCYFKGCQAQPTTDEHAPPKSFFPKDKRINLITVPSCKEHNNYKSHDDLYVLAQVTMNSSPKNRARDVFMKSISPQLEYNQNALRNYLVAGSQKSLLGGVSYKVENKRVGDFFDALCFAVFTKATGTQLPEEYKTGHIYHNLQDCRPLSLYWIFKKFSSFMYKWGLKRARSNNQVNCANKEIYQAEIFGVTGRPITITHVFYGHFRVTSFLTPNNG